MPLNKKGKKIMASMKKQYGKKKGEEVFYAMENSGKLKKVKKARTGYAAEAQYDRGRDPSQQFATSKPKGERISPTGTQDLTKQRKKTIAAISPSTTFGGQALRYGLMYAGVPFSKNITQVMLDTGSNLGYGKKKKTKTVVGGGGGDGQQRIVKPKVQPIQATKPIDKNLIKPKDNFFNFIAYRVGGLSGGVSYGPPPKRGPNPQVPPIKMKKGGYK
tara:strand:+ start:169 stop:819 length:651 start_codon:yes stop_codon:yes gene_type:complete